MPDSSSPSPGWPSPPSGIAANLAGLKTPLPATPDRLQKELDARPLLWVGAGASIAAGYPGTGAILDALAKQADDPIDRSAPFPQVVDAFVDSRGAGELGDILQKLFQPRSPEDHQPTPVHRAIARLAGAGRFHAIATTNYDDLLERALAEAGVPCVLQPLEDNAPIAGDGAVRLLKLHGSLDDWMLVVLSGRSYQEFGHRYPFLSAQLDVLLRQRPVLFAGCSLQDPRLLDWLAARSEEEARGLKPWRALIIEKDWKAATEAVWEGGHASGALARGNIKALLLRDHAHLAELWGEVAGRAVPEVKRLAIEIAIGADGEPWRASLAGCPDWQPRDPLADPKLLEDLATLRKLDHQPLPTTECGQLTAEAAGVAGALRALAADVGERLTEALLSSPARQMLITAIQAGTGGDPPLLHLRVQQASGGEATKRRADWALALPWELLRLDEHFPVEEGMLDLVREAVVPGALGLGTPIRPLSVVATVAAPIDATAFDYEEEMYRLWRALGHQDEEWRLLITDLGTLDELARKVEHFHPPAVHFSGHGRPGVLLFENDAALADEVPVAKLVLRLREAGQLPRLIYLSACDGATVRVASQGNPGEQVADTALAREQTQPSTAASLHRAGFPQVVGYFGPVGDRQATRAAAVFYAALASGKKAREALRRARRVSAEPHQEHDRFTHTYPLGWAQLAFYHRGDDGPTALSLGEGEASVDFGGGRRRIFQRLDRAGGSERVEGIRGVQRLRFGFVGRRKERAEALRRWRRGERQLVVLGLGGLGKTALCAELAPLLAGEAPILALDGRHAGAQPNPVLALWQEVQAAASGDAWSQALAELQKDGVTGEALGRAIVLLAQSTGGLLVYLDDAESLQVPLGVGEIGQFRDPELQRFWEILLEATSTEDPLGLLASSRYLPEGTPRSAELPLSPLPRYDVIRLLSWMPTLGRMPAEDRAWLAEKIDGHPRTIEYLEVLAQTQEEKKAPPGGRYEGTKWREEILEPVLPKTQEKVDADLLLGRVWEALPSEAQEHLGRCTVITAPAPWDAVLALQAEEGTAARLVETGMLSPFQSPLGTDDWWAPHRLVTEEAQRRWTGEPREANRLLGEWYAQKFNEEGRQGWAERAVQHLTDAGEGDGAWPLARLLVIDLRDAGRYREALAWVERVLAAAPTGPRLGNAFALQIQLGLLANVIPENAETILSQALELVGEKDGAYILGVLGRLALHRGEPRKAVDYLERAVQVEISKRGEIHSDVAAAMHELAGVLKAQGDLDTARRNLERALQIEAQVRGTEMHPAVAASLHALAGVLQAQGDLDGARRNLERSLQIKAQVFGTDIHPEVAASLHQLARVLQAQGDLDGARRNLERVLEIEGAVYGTREHYSTAITEVNLGLLLRQQGETEAGTKLLAHAYAVFQKALGPNHPYTRQLAPLFEKGGDPP
jgi:tetratricopeptide (TPR) repeat protein